MKKYLIMGIIDTIPDIQQILKEPDIVTVKLTLVGTPATQNYPRVKIFINYSLVMDDYIVNDCDLTFQTKNIGHLQIRLDYYNKTDNDTVVNDGVIIDNQYVRIEQLIVNGVKLSGPSLCNIARVNYRLTEEQKIIYNSHGYQWENVPSDSLYNNGTWELYLKSPLVTNLLNNKKVISNKFDISHMDVLSKLQNYFKE